jgi:hemoglobin
MVDKVEFPEGDDFSGVKKRNVPKYEQGESILQAAGGETGVQQLVADFYYYIDSLPEAVTIRAMYSHDLTEAQQKLTTFLIGWLGAKVDHVLFLRNFVVQHKTKYTVFYIPGLPGSPGTR